MKKPRSIGIIGHTGVVGGVLYRYFKGLGYTVYGYDVTKGEEYDEVNNSEVVFVCVPTPYDPEKGGYDVSIVNAATRNLADNTITVLKSTMPIGTTEWLQNKFPKIPLLFNPEFLSESTREQDFQKPDRQIVGFTETSLPYASFVLSLLPKSPFDVIVPAKEAELLKYINNLHGVLEIIESNHYYEVCKAEGLSYDSVLHTALQAKWVGVPMNPGLGRHYRDVFHKGFRGFGGKCFPKDLKSWLQYCKEKGIDASLFETAQKINNKLLKEQGLTEKEVERG